MSVYKNQLLCIKKHANNNFDKNPEHFQVVIDEIDNILETLELTEQDTDSYSGDLEDFEDIEIIGESEEQENE